MQRGLDRDVAAKNGGDEKKSALWVLSCRDKEERSDLLGHGMGPDFQGAGGKPIMPGCVSRRDLCLNDHFFFIPLVAGIIRETVWPLTVA
jgi:hypothetical protein